MDTQMNTTNVEIQMTSKAFRVNANRVIPVWAVLCELPYNSLAAALPDKPARMECEVTTAEDGSNDVLFSFADYCGGMNEEELLDANNLGSEGGHGRQNQNGYGLKLLTDTSKTVLIITKDTKRGDNQYRALLRTRGSAKSVLYRELTEEMLSAVEKYNKPSTLVITRFDRCVASSMVKMEAATNDEIAKRIYELYSVVLQNVAPLAPISTKYICNQGWNVAEKTHVDMTFRNYPGKVDDYGNHVPRANTKLYAFPPYYTNVQNLPREIHLQAVDNGTIKHDEKSFEAFGYVCTMDEAAVKEFCMEYLHFDKEETPIWSYGMNMDTSGIMYFQNGILVARKDIGNMKSSRLGAEIIRHPNYNSIMMMVNLGEQSPEFFATSPLKSETDTTKGDWSKVHRAFSTPFSDAIVDLLKFKDRKKTLATMLFTASSVQTNIRIWNGICKERMQATGDDVLDGKFSMLFSVNSNLNYDAIRTAYNLAVDANRQPGVRKIEKVVIIAKSDKDELLVHAPADVCRVLPPYKMKLKDFLKIYYKAGKKGLAVEAMTYEQAVAKYSPDDSEE